MLIILFFLFYDDEQEHYVHLQSSYERGNHVLFYAYDYLVDKYVSLYLHLPEEKLLKTVQLIIASDKNIVNLLLNFKFYQKFFTINLKFNMWISFSTDFSSVHWLSTAFTQNIVLLISCVHKVW